MKEKSDWIKVEDRMPDDPCEEVIGFADWGTCVCTTECGVLIPVDASEHDKKQMLKGLFKITKWQPKKNNDNGNKNLTTNRRCKMMKVEQETLCEFCEDENDTNRGTCEGAYRNL